MSWFKRGKEVSDESLWLICSSNCITVVIDGGSRYEVDYPSGLSHLLEKLSFQVWIFVLDCIFLTTFSYKNYPAQRFINVGYIPSYTWL